MHHLIGSRDDADDWEVDSCGTGDWHIGAEPDSRTMAVLHRHGITYRHRGRQLEASDYQRFDYLLAMDENNLAEARRRAPKGCRATIMLLRDVDPAGPGPVPDPYYGGDDGFDQVFELVERSCDGFLNRYDAGELPAG